jgi:hypothetical protein
VRLRASKKGPHRGAVVRYECDGTAALAAVAWPESEVGFMPTQPAVSAEIQDATAAEGSTAS